MTRSRHAGVRLAWLVVGCIAVALAGLGVVLPLLPTTPFALVAAFAFMRSSRRLHAWLTGHRIFGPLITDWRRYGAIRRSTKVVGIASMAGVFALSFVLDVQAAVLAIQAPVLLACAVFVASRPEPPPG